MHSERNSTKILLTDNSGLFPYCSHFLSWYLLLGILFGILIIKNSNKILLEIYELVLIPLLIGTQKYNSLEAYSSDGEGDGTPHP